MRKRRKCGSACNGYGTECAYQHNFSCPRTFALKSDRGGQYCFQYYKQAYKIVFPVIQKVDSPKHRQRNEEEYCHVAEIFFLFWGIFFARGKFTLRNKAGTGNSQKNQTQHLKRKLVLAKYHCRGKKYSEKYSERLI